MSLLRYALIVVAVLGGSLAVLWPALGLLGADGRWAAAAGGALATANSVAAYALVVWSANRPTKVLLGAVLGGMVGRMTLMLAAVAAVLGLGLRRFPPLPLTLSLLAYFVVFLVFELAVVQRTSSARVEA